MESSHTQPQTSAGSGSPRFDLIDVVQTLVHRRRFILLVTVAALVVGALTHFVSKKKYKATTEVFLSNPLLNDRSYVFPSVGVPAIDYFGGEDMIDKAMVIGSSENTLEELARQHNLAKAYGIDTITLKGRAKLVKTMDEQLLLKRTEYGNLRVSYTDTDPRRAADVANSAVEAIEGGYHRFYSAKRRQVVASLRAKSVEADSAISVLTDSLASMRDRYGIYEILSPNRTTGLQSSSTGTRNGRAIEEVQNVESLKDQWVIDRARNLGIMNEMSTGNAVGQTPILYVLSRAVPPSSPAGLRLILSLAAWGIAGALFAALWVLFTTYVRKMMTVQRDA